MLEITNYVILGITVNYAEAHNDDVGLIRGRWTNLIYDGDAADSQET